ncbi:MAG: glycosyltransferase, partial [Myxococcales bacterium]|nr:glycosyltransferase [Myxococcales bacterium]
MTPRRILMTADCVGGVWTYTLDLARALCAQGIEVIVAAMGQAPTTDQLAAARAIDGLTLDARPYKLEWRADSHADL